MERAAKEADYPGRLRLISNNHQTRVVCHNCRIEDFWGDFEIQLLRQVQLAGALGVAVVPNGDDDSACLTLGRAPAEVQKAQSLASQQGRLNLIAHESVSGIGWLRRTEREHTKDH